MNWPSTTDPWNLANPTDNATRRSYYGFNGIPIVAVEGDTLPSYSASNWTVIRNLVTQRLAMPSHVWMSMSGQVTTAGDSVYVTVKLVADSAFGAGNKLYIAVTSYADHWTTPSPNGETDFFNNMFKMYPNGGGADFTHSGHTTDTTTVVARFSLRLTGTVPMRPENMKMTAWVQTTATKDVVQSKSIITTPMLYPHSTDTLYVDVPAVLRWTTEAYSDNVTIELDRNYPSGTWQPVVENTANDGEYEVTLTGATSASARFRIIQTSDPARGDTMRAGFHIEPSTTITATPNPMEAELAIGDTLVSSVVLHNPGTVSAHVRLTVATGTDNYGVRDSDEGRTFSRLGGLDRSGSGRPGRRRCVLGLHAAVVIQAL